MEKKELEINGKKVVIMEQPASFVLKLEKEYGDLDLISYVKEIIKYPSGVNKCITELINIPDEIKYGEFNLKLPEDKENALYEMLDLFKQINSNNININLSFVAERFLKKLNKNIDDFKFRELEEIGKEVFEQVKDIAYLYGIKNTFRNF